MASGTGIAPVTQGLENILGINTTAGTQQLQQALQALQAVGVPTAQMLDLPTLQQYVSAGVLTPAQYQAIQANPNAYSQMIQQTQNTTGQTAEQQALQELGGVVNAGGSTAINKANLLNNLNQVNQQQQAARAGNLENAQQRGVAGGGLEFLNNMVGNQQGAQNANANAVNSAANNAQLALQAMTQQGQLGGQLQGQSNQMSQAQAQAAQQIAEYNSQLQSSANQYNTQNANAAQAANLQNAQNIANANTQNKNYVTQYNAQVPETVFANQNQLANEEAQQYGNQANLAEQQAANQNNFTGNLLGTAGQVAGDYYMGNALNGANSTGGAITPAGPQGASTYGNDVTSPGYQQNNQLLGQQTLGSAGPNVNPSNYAMGGEAKCYAKGGEAHSHEICMKIGGPVPGTPKVPGAVDTTKNDTIPAKLSPHEIVLPRSVTQGPNPVRDAAKFVGAIKGGVPPQQAMPKPLSFADVIKRLEQEGLSLKIGSK